MKFRLLYEYGYIDLGNGCIAAKRNRLTGSITLLLSNSTTQQMFSTSTAYKYDTYYDEDGYGMGAQSYKCLEKDRK